MMRVSYWGDVHIRRFFIMHENLGTTVKKEEKGYESDLLVCEQGYEEPLFTYFHT